MVAINHAVSVTRNVVVIAPVWVYNRQTYAYVDTYYLSDHGATINECSQCLASNLNLGVDRRV